MATNFQLGKTYSFNVYGGHLMTETFKNTTVLAILDYDSARAFLDLLQMHRQLWAFIPNGLAPNDPAQYNYLKLRMANGDTTVVGIPWINDSSVELVTSQTAVVTIDGVSAMDLTRIRNALVQNGFYQLSVKMQ